MRRIAVIGAGISGLYAAHLLKDDFDVVVFEGNDYPGGHAHSVPVESNGQTLDVDTGFVVHNRVAYPNFVALLERLGVATRPASMSFSASCAASGVEWGGETLNGVFAQRRNLLRP